MALQAEGFAVEQAGNGIEGLARLTNASYDLVITDYDMPVKTGALMLKEAASRGLLGSAAAILVTAHPEPEGAEDVEIIRKPIDLGQFLTEISIRLRREKPAEPDAEASPHLEAILYVSSGSRASLRARRYIEALLARTPGSGVRFEVCDLARDASRAETDGVVYTPTLVRRSPGPPVWIVGDLTTNPIVPELLGVPGEE